MKANEGTGGAAGRKPRAPGDRPGGSRAEPFSASFRHLKQALRGACGREEAWQRRIVAAIQAAMDFAAANPGVARALTVDARDREEEIVGHFAALLGSVAQAERRSLIPSDEGIIASIVILVRGHLLRGTASRLPALTPDLAYLVLMPYMGLGEARRWAETFGCDRGG